MELEALGAISGKVLDAGCGLGDNVIYGKQQLHIFRVGFFLELAGEVEFVVFDQRFADLLACGLEKCVSHSARDQ